MESKQIYRQPSKENIADPNRNYKNGSHQPQSSAGASSKNIGNKDKS